MDILYFSAPGCVPCQAVRRQVEAIVAERVLRLTVIDVERYMRTAEHYGVSSIPTVIVIDYGSEACRFTGSKAGE